MISQRVFELELRLELSSTISGDSLSRGVKAWLISFDSLVDAVTNYAFKKKKKIFCRIILKNVFLQFYARSLNEIDKITTAIYLRNVFYTFENFYPLCC